MHTLKRLFRRVDGPLLHGTLAGCVVMIISSLGLFYLWHAAREAQLDAVRTELVQLARVAATLVDGDRHRELKSQAQAGSSDHLALLTPLVRFHKATSDIIYVYTAVLDKNRIYYVLGTDYLYRAGVARCCLGENLPQDALYPSAGTDSEGQPLDGNGKYVIHFAKGQLPPVDAFWSVTAYDKDGYFIPNPLKRQALGVHDGLVGNADGSIDLAIQADSPGKDREANWLPVGKGPFTLMMRLYAPRAEAIEGGWQPPPIQRVH